MVKVKPCTVLSQRQGVGIESKPRLQQIEITGGNQRPVEQPVVLVPIRATPCTVICVVLGRCGPRALGKIMAYSEQPAIELRRVRPTRRGRHHVTLQNVTLRSEEHTSELQSLRHLVC